MDDAIKTTAEAAEEATLPERYAVRMGPNGSIVRENQVVSPNPNGRQLEQKSPAEWAYERIVMYIQKFEETLNGDEEVGMGFTGGDVGTLRIQGMGYFAPDLITFYGEDPNGAKTQLVQHVSQLNVMLVSSPKVDEEQEPNRIGFKLAAELDNPSAT
jgi:hypothetical protein